MVPCKDCLLFPMCRDKEMNELLIKCPILKRFMEKGLNNFDNAIEFLSTTKERNKHEKIEKEKD